MKEKRFARRGLLAALIAAVILAGAFSHGRMRELRQKARAEARAALAGVLSPAEIMGATVLGGFRSIAINIVWLRLLNRLEEGRLGELLGLYGALETLQGGSPSVYRILAEQMAFDVARRLPHEPGERWRWIRRGLELLERGRRRFPASLQLDRHAAYLYLYRFHPLRSPGDRERFLAEPRDPDGHVPYGREPVLVAMEAGEEALAEPRHPFHVDVLLWVIYREAYALFARAPGYLERAGRLLEHALIAHPDLPLLRSWQEQLQAEKEESQPPLPPK